MITFFGECRAQENADTPGQRTGVDLTPVEEDRFVSAVKKLPAAYQVLARGSALPKESIDPAGKLLPKEFAAYSADENGGWDRFVAGLSNESREAFIVFRDCFGKLGVLRMLEWAAFSKDVIDTPSMAGFILHTSLRMEIHEYPSAIGNVSQAEILKFWQPITRSSNPLLRLLGICETRRMIKDRTTMLALLDTRIEETDPVLVEALIGQFAQIGGVESRRALTTISVLAAGRKDQLNENAAKEALANLK